MKDERQKDKRWLADEKFVRAGHPPENTNCDHRNWIFEKDGRYCPCGTVMIDFGD